MTTFINKITEQVVEIADHLRDWFLADVSDAEDWIEQGVLAVDAPADSPAPEQELQHEEHINAI